jgi:hypothetical protein
MALLIAIPVALTPGPALAHPHVLISQVVRFVEKDGAFTHVEIEWRFDPMASELEIAAADEDRDGKISGQEMKALGDLATGELKGMGYLTWLNTGDKDFRPSKAPVFSARIASPAVFAPFDWAPTPDAPGGPMPGASGKNAKPQAPHNARNLVYTLRFELPKPGKSVAVSAIDPEDFVRIELDKKAPWEIVGGNATCVVDKHTSVKSEYWPGNPFYADRVSCKLP